jgi:hypothetical protein
MYFMPWVPYIPQPLPSSDQAPDAKLDNKRKYKRTWSRQQVENLYTLAKECSEAQGKTMEELQLGDFEVISSKTQQSPAQCMNKLQEVLATGTLRAGVWSPEEDTLLQELMQDGRKKWSEIANRLNSDMHKGLQVRSGKQCKERWNNHLNPDINRGDWSLEEDICLLEHYQKAGNRWSLIAKQLPTRTESSIKNRIKSIINKAKQDLTTLEKPAEVISRLLMRKKLKLAGRVSIEVIESASPASGRGQSRSSGVLSFASLLEAADSKECSS